ncbi:hypothetical protein KCP71_11590 [Salmonella enterica subsp. enterica]|nr:hypothetical protein KCP71_11590 [Salmonella enterica subsp. enterica]
MSELFAQPGACIDGTNSPEKAEATKSYCRSRSPKAPSATVTFDVVSGEKMMAVFRLADGDFPTVRRAEVKTSASSSWARWPMTATPAGGRSQNIKVSSFVRARSIVTRPRLPELRWSTRRCKMLEGQAPTAPQKSSPLPAQPLIQNIRKTDGQPAGGDNHSNSPPIPLADNHAVNRTDRE